MIGYHAKNKKRIKNGELRMHFETDCWPGMGKAIVLVFYDEPLFCPVDKGHWNGYRKVLSGQEQKEYSRRLWTKEV